MHLPSRVFLNDKNRLLPAPFFCAAPAAAGLGRAPEIAFLAIGRSDLAAMASFKASEGAAISRVSKTA